MGNDENVKMSDDGLRRLFNYLAWLEPLVEIKEQDAEATEKPARSDRNRKERKNA